MVKSLRKRRNHKSIPKDFPDRDYNVPRGRELIIAEERRHSARWFYLSFADSDGFRGAAIVRAQGTITAVERAMKLGIHPYLKPGGEAQCWKLNEQDMKRIPADMRNRLLTEAEVRERLEGKTIAG